MGFVPRSDGKKFEGKTFDPIVKEYALKDKIVKTGQGEDDFIIEKVPVKVDEYDLNKVIQARAEGCSLKEMIKRIQSGEMLPEGRSPQYVDTTSSPQSLEEALEKKVKTEAILDAAKLGDLSSDEIKELSKLVKMTPGQVQAFVNNLVKASSQKAKKVEAKIPGVASEEVKIPGVEKKEGNN